MLSARESSASKNLISPSICPSEKKGREEEKEEKEKKYGDESEEITVNNKKSTLTTSKSTSSSPPSPLPPHPSASAGFAPPSPSIDTQSHQMDVNMNMYNNNTDAADSISNTNTNNNNNNSYNNSNSNTSYNNSSSSIPNYEGESSLPTVTQLPVPTLSPPGAVPPAYSPPILLERNSSVQQTKNTREDTANTQMYYDETSRTFRPLPFHQQIPPPPSRPSLSNSPPPPQAQQQQQLFLHQQNAGPHFIYPSNLPAGGSSNGVYYPSSHPTNQLVPGMENTYMMYFNPQAFGFNESSGGKDPRQGYALVYPYVPVNFHEGSDAHSGGTRGGRGTGGDVNLYSSPNGTFGFETQPKIKQKRTVCC